MTQEKLIQELSNAQEYFERSTRCLSEQDSDFAPAEGVYSVAHQVAHVAQTVDWFVQGAFRAFDQAREVIGSKSEAELRETLPADSILGAMPRHGIVPSISDHTSHHRGALTVYSRLLGKVPKMPYADE